MSEERWDIPLTWSWSSLGELAEVVGGGTPSTSDDSNFSEHGIAWLTPADLTDYKDTYIARGRRDLSEQGYRLSAARLLPPGTVLFTSRAPIGYCAIASTEISTNQGFKSFVLKGGISPEYIRYYLLASVEYAESKASGTTFKELSGSRAAELTVPISPLPEQRRIVTKIDSLSAKSKRARDHLDHTPLLVEKYKQAILAAAFRGNLTADWRASNARKNSSEWNKRQLIDICDAQRPITYGVIKLGPEMPNGVPCLRTSNVRWLRVDVEGMKRISPKLSSEYARTVLRGGEVLVNVRGTLGGVAVATPSMTGWNVSREVAVAPVDTAVVEPNYLAFWIGAYASQRWLNRVEKGVAYTGINLEDLRKLPVEFPSMDQQREIIRRIETAFALIDRLACEVTNARKLIDHLDQAVLAKAFMGELVPQDPSDEPASMLLDELLKGRAK
jgi:type I restriction enzyme S subunit